MQVSDNLDKSWHLANHENVKDLTEFEFLLWRAFYGFIRWQEDCESKINSLTLTGHELALLHIIRMNDAPKTIYEVARLLNRDDISNVQYGIKKLAQLGLVEQAKGGTQKAVNYQATKKGIKDTDLYTKTREHVLGEVFKNTEGLQNIKETIKTLALMKNVYDEASRVMSTYKGLASKE